MSHPYVSLEGRRFHRSDNPAAGEGTVMGFAQRGGDLVAVPVTAIAAPELDRVKIEVTDLVGERVPTETRDARRREMQVRVQSALMRNGIDHGVKVFVPGGRSGMDLAAVAAALVALGLAPARPTWGFIGEVALNGNVRPTRFVAHATGPAHERMEGWPSTVVVPAGTEGQIIGEAIVVGTIQDLIEAMTAGDASPKTRAPSLRRTPHLDAVADRIAAGDEGMAQRTFWQKLSQGVELASKRGAVLVVDQSASHPRFAVRDVVSHIRYVTGLLPQIGPAEEAEIRRVYSAAGIEPMVPPFRAPHHTVSEAGMRGDVHGRPGEAQLAHHGLLLLDEADEFRSVVLEAALKHRKQALIVAVIRRRGAEPRLPKPILAVPHVVLRVGDDGETTIDDGSSGRSANPHVAWTCRVCGDQIPENLADEHLAEHERAPARECDHPSCGRGCDIPRVLGGVDLSVQQRNELAEMQSMLQRHGFSGALAERLYIEGIGPTELAERLRNREGVGSLEHTHGFRRGNPSGAGGAAGELRTVADLMNALQGVASSLPKGIVDVSYSGRGQTPFSGQIYVTFYNVTPEQRHDQTTCANNRAIFTITGLPATLLKAGESIPLTGLLKGGDESAALPEKVGVHEVVRLFGSQTKLRRMTARPSQVVAALTRHIRTITGEVKSRAPNPRSETAVARALRMMQRSKERGLSSSQAAAELPRDLLLDAMEDIGLHPSSDPDVRAIQRRWEESLSR